MVRMEFGKNKGETDEAKIQVMKAGAIRALSNYMLYESGAKDQRLGKAMNKFNNDTIRSREEESGRRGDGSKK